MAKAHSTGVGDGTLPHCATAPTLVLSSLLTAVSICEPFFIHTAAFHPCQVASWELTWQYPYMDASTPKSGLSTITPCLGNKQREVIVDGLLKKMESHLHHRVAGLEFSSKERSSPVTGRLTVGKGHNEAPHRSQGQPQYWRPALEPNLSHPTISIRNNSNKKLWSNFRVS